MVAISLRINDVLKTRIQSIASKLGLSMNQLINLKLSEFLSSDSINLNIKFDDTDFEFYNSKDFVNVDISANDVLEYIKKNV